MLGAGLVIARLGAAVLSCEDIGAGLVHGWEQHQLHNCIGGGWEQVLCEAGSRSCVRLGAGLVHGWEQVLCEAGSRSCVRLGAGLV